jgi:hypothetical protein
MSNIRMTSLPATTTVLAEDVLPMDGATTRKIKPVDLLTSVRPFATQPEAEAGVNSTSTMSPLTTAQAIAAQLPSTAAGKNLLAAADPAAQRGLLGLGGAAVLAVGTTAGTVAAGDDSRITGAAQKSANLSDLASASTSRTNLGLGGAAVLNVGSSPGTVAAGDDIRFAGVAGIADQATAEAGVNNSTLMSPLRSAQALEANVISAANAASDPATPADGIQSTKLGFSHPAVTSPAVVVSHQVRMAQGLSLADVAGATVFGGGQDVTTLMQRLASICAAEGYTARLGKGQFTISDTVLFDETGGATVTAPRGGLIGDGSGTQITVAANVAGIEFRGGASVSGDVGYHVRVGDFMLLRSGLVGNGTGIKIDNYAWSDFERIAIYGFDAGISATDFLSSTLRRVTVRNCKRGIDAAYSDFSRPNALSFIDVELGLNTEYGALINSPATLNWIGGAVEGNGIGGTGSLGFQGGVKIINGGTEGAAGVAFRSVYFEKNKGSADINIDHTANRCVYLIDGCTFNRIDSTDYVINNVAVAAGGTSFIAVDISASGFQGYGSYTENAGRQYIAVTGLSNAAVVVDDVTTRQFGSNAAFTEPGAWGPATRAGSVAANGAALSLPRGWSSANGGTGIYTVTHSLGTTDYGVGIVTNSANSNRVERILLGSNSFTVVVTNTGNALTNDAFAFTLRRN